MSEACRARRGFTLIEIVVAIVLLTVGLLALAASAAATVRSMAEAARIASAAHMAENERERAYATTCAAAGGVDSARGATVVWSAEPAGPMLSIAETITRPRATPVVIAAAGACR